MNHYYYMYQSVYARLCCGNKQHWRFTFHSCCQSMSSSLFHAFFTLRSRLMELFLPGISPASWQKEKRTVTWNSSWFKSFSFKVRYLTSATIQISFKWGAGLTSRGWGILILSCTITFIISVIFCQTLIICLHLMPLRYNLGNIIFHCNSKQAQLI